MAWSGKKVKELLVELSEDGKMFKTKPSTKKVTSKRTGYKLTTQGYFEIGEAYGGYKLAYVLPYSGHASAEVTSGYIGSGKLAEKLIDFGSLGLRREYERLEKFHKASRKDMWMDGKL